MSTFLLFFLVRVKGFEPPTFWSQTRRSAKLSYTRIYFVWLGKQDSNLQPAVPKTDALPIELLPNMVLLDGFEPPT